MSVTDRVRDHRADVLRRYSSAEFLNFVPRRETTGVGAVETTCDTLYAAKSLYSEWSFAEPDSDARAQFATLANKKQQQLEQLGGHLPYRYEASADGAVYEHLCELHVTERRLGGTLARTLLEQCTYDSITEGRSLPEEVRDSIETIRMDTETTVEEIDEITAGWESDRREKVYQECCEVLELSGELLDAAGSD